MQVKEQIRYTKDFFNKGQMPEGKCLPQLNAYWKDGPKSN